MNKRLAVIVFSFFLLTSITWCLKKTNTMQTISHDFFTFDVDPAYTATAHQDETISLLYTAPWERMTNSITITRNENTTELRSFVSQYKRGLAWVITWTQESQTHECVDGNTHTFQDLTFTKQQIPWDESSTSYYFQRFFHDSDSIYMISTLSESSSLQKSMSSNIQESFSC